MYMTTTVRFARWILVLTLSVGIVLGDPSQAAVRLVAEEGSSISGKTILSFDPSGIVHGPDLNNSGVVVFGARFGTDPLDKGIFTENAILYEVTTFSSAFAPQINESGAVVFHNGSGAATLGGIVAQNGDTIGGLTLLGFREPVIDDSGLVTFGASLSSPSGQGIFNPGAVLFQSGDNVGGKTLAGAFTNSNIVANNSGMVAFHGIYDGPEPINQRSAIFTQGAVLVEQGDVIDGRTITFIGNRLSLNDSGDVAFRGFFAGRSGIFTQNRLLVAGDSTIDGVEITSVQRPSINNLGQVSFIAGIAAGGVGLFTQDCLIARTGDVIDGRTITSFGFGDSNYSAINDAGDVAFWAEFTGGSGVFLFEGGCAQGVPAQGLIGLAGLMAILMAVFGWSIVLRRRHARLPL